MHGLGNVAELRSYRGAGQRLLQPGQDAVAILGRENRVQWRNPAARRLLALRKRSSIGTPIDTLVRDPVFTAYMEAGDFTRALELPAPGDRSIMLSILDSGSDVNYALWNGSSWDARTELETNSTETTNQPFLFLWNSQSP